MLDLVAEEYRRRIFFNYERRLRMRSPPEKVNASLTLVHEVCYLGYSCLHCMKWSP